MSTRFIIGERVRIDHRYEHRHHRVPGYVKGKEGVIMHLCHRQGLPEELAYRKTGDPKQIVYRVRIPLAELWSDYDGTVRDNLEIEIFEHWLEAL